VNAVLVAKPPSNSRKAFAVKGAESAVTLPNTFPVHQRVRNPRNLVIEVFEIFQALFEAKALVA